MTQSPTGFALIRVSRDCFLTMAEKLRELQPEVNQLLAERCARRFSVDCRLPQEFRFENTLLNRLNYGY
jgi:hypothetical protein